MRRKAYGRDFGLTSRMFLTIFLLGALYVGFFALLLQSGASIGVMVVILGAFAFIQYFTSDKIALASSGAKVVNSRAGAGPARDGRAALRHVRPAQAANRGDPHGHPKRLCDRP